MSKVALNGRAQLKDEDFGRILQQLIDARGVPPGVSPGYVQPDQVNGGRHASTANAAAAPIWSSEPVAVDEGIRATLRSALQGLACFAKRAMGHAAVAWVRGTEVARSVLANKWVKRFDLLALAAFVVVVLVARLW